MTADTDKSISGSNAIDPAVVAYKELLRGCLDRRPSGIRARLAQALGRNPSFISQISNPVYGTPIPAAHIKTIFEICHFSSLERQQFLAAFERAHPNRSPKTQSAPRYRRLTLNLQDTGSAAKNREIDLLLEDFAKRLSRVLAQETATTATADTNTTDRNFAADAVQNTSGGGAA